MGDKKRTQGAHKGRTGRSKGKDSNLRLGEEQRYLTMLAGCLSGGIAGASLTHHPSRKIPMVNAWVGGESHILVNGLGS